MKLLSKVSAAPALFVRVVVSVAAIASFGLGLAAFITGRIPATENLPLAGVLLILVAALTRRYGIALPGNGFSSFVLGVMLFAILYHGWAFAAIVAPFAMLVGDLLLRRLPLRAAFGNAAHLTAGSTFVGFMYERLGGVSGAAALSADNIGIIALTIVMLPIIVNGTFYLELALGQTWRGSTPGSRCSGNPSSTWHRPRWPWAGSAWRRRRSAPARGWCSSSRSGSAPPVSCTCSVWVFTRTSSTSSSGSPRRSRRS